MQPEVAITRKNKPQLVLSPEESQRFIAAASALLAQQEKLEMLGEQAKEQLGGVSGEVKMARSKLEEVRSSTHVRLRVLAAINIAHPRIHALRFRGRIFSLAEVNGQPVLSVIMEANVVHVGE